jgi:TPR repeat protein
MKRILFPLVVALATCSSPSSAQTQLKVPGMDPQLFLDRAEAGDPVAQFQLGLRMVTPQEATTGEVKEGASWIRKSATQGHAPAMHVLGEFYEKGVGVPKDETLAFEWQQKASDLGMPEATLSLALMMDDGRGTAKNPEKAAELALQLAKKEFSQQSVAQTLYAQKALIGNGVKKNSAKAAMWFLKASQLGHPFAQRQLAYLYYTGEGVPVDYARCEAWYRLAVQGNSEPMVRNDLAWFLSTCPDGKFHKAEEAVSLAKEAIKSQQNFEDRQSYEIIDTMAAALARNGQHSEAIIWQKRSLSLLSQDSEIDSTKRTELEAEFNKRLLLYKQNEAYTEAPPKTPEIPGEPLYNDDVLENKSRSQRRPMAPGLPEEPKPQAPKKQKVI